MTNFDRFRLRQWVDHTMLHYNGITEPLRAGSVYDSVLMQCTGLKDKNGKLIYEGDILKYHHDLWELVWSNEYQLRSINGNPSCVYPCYNMLQVIGNIYENPELLEDK